MEKESIEFYKWDKQNAIILKHNCERRPYNTIYFKDEVPFIQITDGGSSTSDFYFLEENKYDLVILCPKICKEYKIVVSKYEIEKLNIKDIKVLFDIISYIEDFKAKAKCCIMEVIHKYLNV